MSTPAADPSAATLPDPAAIPPTVDADPAWAAAARAWLVQSDARFARRFDAGEPADKLVALRTRGVHAVVAHQSISARMPTPAERRHLRIRGTQPVLAMTRMAFDGAGTAVEYGDHSYRAEDYTIDLMVDER